MVSTLYNYLKDKAPPFSDLQKKYNPLLQLVDILIGTIPNCDVVMEIWPTSFQTYNLLVPNLLNLPASLFGNKEIKRLMGLAMYHSSASAGCNYCTAHTCSFALRRGLDESVILGESTSKESAVINFSRKMAEVPCMVTKDDFLKLKDHCNSKEIEAVSMGIVLMGFLNKYMDVLGVELEQEAIDDVADLLQQTTWTVGKHADGEIAVSPFKKKLEKDNFLTYLKVIRQAPGAVSLESKWLKDTPKGEEAMGNYLKKQIGHNFSVLSKLKRPKLKRTFVTILCNNFSDSTTKIGLKAKVLCGLVFSTIVGNAYLKNEMIELAKNNSMELSTEHQKNILAFSSMQKAVPAHLAIEEKVALHFTKKASTSPAFIDSTLMQEIMGKLAPDAIVELITWLSILQAIHRLEKLPTL